MPTASNENTPHADLVAFLNTIGNVAADKVNPAFRSKYSSLAEILDTVKAEAAKHNLAVRQVIQSEDGKVSVVTSFLHRSGIEFDGGKVSFKSDGLNPQQLGSVLTYLRRAALSTGCCISTDVDDDGAKASALQAKPATATTPSPAESANWFAFIPLDLRIKAVKYLASKGWVDEDSVSLHDVPADKVEIIVGNKPAFLKAINR